MITSMSKPRLLIAMIRLLYSLLPYIVCVFLAVRVPIGGPMGVYEFSPAVLQSQIVDMHAHGNML